MNTDSLARYITSLDDEHMSAFLVGLMVGLGRDASAMIPEGSK